ncbi:MAG: YbaK/EbsC family protein [Ferrovibrio sp.]|uniref:YbaK/EbsC family protein n=1 Tax=Ferrovibrio sp. TaxID=1917215 RepID=UPI003918D9F2
MAEAILENASVKRVREALLARGAGERVIVLDGAARTAAEAAAGLGCEVGAIVKSLVFAHESQEGEKRPVMALVAGDRQCDVAALGRALGLAASPGQGLNRADAALVRRATGFAIGGVAPLGHMEALPIVIDDSLARFPLLHAAAGHPHAVFPLSYSELVAWTGGKPAAISAV